jgi:hypothetical protein
VEAPQTLIVLFYFQPFFHTSGIFFTSANIFIYHIDNLPRRVRQVSGAGAPEALTGYLIVPFYLFPNLFFSHYNYFSLLSGKEESIPSLEF